MSHGLILEVVNSSSCGLRHLKRISSSLQKAIHQLLCHLLHVLHGQRLLGRLFHLLGGRISLKIGPLALVVDDLVLFLEDLVPLWCLCQSKYPIQQLLHHILKQGVF